MGSSRNHLGEPVNGRRVIFTTIRVWVVAVGIVAVTGAGAVGQGEPTGDSTPSDRFGRRFHLPALRPLRRT